MIHSSVLRRDRALAALNIGVSPIEFNASRSRSLAKEATHLWMHEPLECRALLINLWISPSAFERVPFRRIRISKRLRSSNCASQTPFLFLASTIRLNARRLIVDLK